MTTLLPKKKSLNFVTLMAIILCSEAFDNLLEECILTACFKLQWTCYCDTVYTRKYQYIQIIQSVECFNLASHSFST